MGAGDVAQHAPGADRGQLLVVPDEPDAAAGAEDVVHDPGQVGGGRHPRLVDHGQGARPDLGHPLAALVRLSLVGVCPVGVWPVGAVEGVGELGQGVGVRAELFAQDCGRGRGGGQADDVAAAVGPGLGQDPHRRGLPGACGGHGQLESGA